VGNYEAFCAASPSRHLLVVLGLGPQTFSVEGPRGSDSGGLSPLARTKRNGHL